jgi:hypothetical protein
MRKRQKKNIRIAPMPGEGRTPEAGFMAYPGPMEFGKPGNISMPESHKRAGRKECTTEDMWYLGVEMENAEWEVMERFFREVVLKGKPLEKWEEEKALGMFEKKFNKFNSWRKKITEEITKKSKTKQEFVLRIKEAMRSYKEGKGK